MKTFEEVMAIQQRFINQYFTPPINSVGISRIDLCLDGGAFAPIHQDETSKDFCLSVGIEAVPPDILTYPTVYDGVRVFYKAVGEIKAL